MTYTKTLYETDSVAWADEQAKLLRDRQWDKLDLENLIEEVQDLGGRHRDRIESFLQNLLMHLLKRNYQPDKQTTSWDMSIRTSALNIRKEIKKRPSLRRHFVEQFAETYQYAREMASIETGLALEDFPEGCPPDIQDEVWTSCETE